MIENKIKMEKWNSYDNQRQKQLKKGGSYLPFGGMEFRFVPRLTRIKLGLFMLLGINIKYFHVNIKDSHPKDVQKWVEEHPELSEAMRIATEAFAEEEFEE